VVDIIFIEPDGTKRSLEVKEGLSLMEAAIANNVQGIVAECGGAGSCATCHGYIDENWMEIVGAAGLDETEMLEFVSGLSTTSRLTCQIDVNSRLNGMVVRVPETQG